MNKVDFYNILDGEQVANNQDILSLEALLKTYPYFGLGQCMYLDALKKSGNTKYDSELHLRAPFVNNRTLLQKVNTDTFILPKTSDVEAIDESKTIDPKTAEHIEVDENVEIIYDEFEVSSKKKSKKKDKKKKAKKKSHSDNKPTTNDVVNDLIHSESIGYQILNDLNAKAEEKNNEKEISAEPEVIEPVTTVTIPTNYLDWLKSKSHNSTAPQIINIEHQAPPKSDDLLTVSDLLGEKVAKGSKSEKDVLKSFLSNKSSQREKIKTYDAHELVSKSIEDNSDMVTETLGRIYASQGLQNKAKEVYEKLILLNPEKSSYFADLIDKLDKN